VRVVFLAARNLLFALLDELRIVEIAAVRRDAIVVAEIIGAREFLTAQQTS
jgi:hypothetical protein